jgi:hypothetical protein
LSSYASVDVRVMLVEVVGRWSWIITVRSDVRCKRADSASVPMAHDTPCPVVWIIVASVKCRAFVSSCSACSIVAILMVGVGRYLLYLG